VLDQVADWMNSTYKRGKTVDGIVYLQSITTDRMTRAACQHTRVFANICGHHGLSNVILVISKWPDISERWIARETEIRQNFWIKMIEYGSRTGRFRLHKDNASKSQADAWKIVNSILEPRCLTSSEYKSQALLLQEEMVDLRQTLLETTAGRILLEGVNELLRRLEEVIEKLKADVRGGDVNAAKRLRDIERQYREAVSATLPKTKLSIPQKLARLLAPRRTASQHGVEPPPTARAASCQ